MSTTQWLPYREHDTILIVDFGGQYTHLIARRVREHEVYSEIVPYLRASREVIEEIKPKGIILSGGPRSVYLPDSPKIGKWIFELGVPVLGICYGHQLIAYLFGGKVESGHREYGRTRVRILRQNTLFEDWEEEEIVWMSHSDAVVKLPEDFEVLAISENNVIAAFKHRDLPIYGVQFHPEVVHTPKGKILFRNFLFKICKVKSTWKIENIVDAIVQDIKRTVPENEKVLCAVSGGVDSTVTAVLLKRAIGDRLVAVFVNHGLFREGEVEEVLSTLESIGLNVTYIDASQKFISNLIGVEDPEERRLIIGRIFADIFREIASKDPEIKWLAQGTTYPDVIESGAMPGADRIKSHHNVAGLPQDLGLKLVEPLRYLYKDEVRAIGRLLGLPDSIVKRHPFPGPGLAVRIIGKFTLEKLEIVRKASKIVEEEIRKAGLYDKVWQAFAVVGDDKWVGVKGDKRALGYIVTIRIVESEDGMTADWTKVPYDVLDRIARRIVNEIPQVTMVTYAITTKPPSTIEPL